MQNKENGFLVVFLIICYSTQAYVDSSVIMGQTGQFQKDVEKYANIEYMRSGVHQRMDSFLIYPLLLEQISYFSVHQTILLALLQHKSN